MEAGAADRGEALSELTRDDLYERTEQLDIPGRRSMTKAELLDAIRKTA